MKKLLVIALAVLLVGAFTVPAMAVDHEFGGYWRTRFFSATDFSGDDSEAQDGRQVDTRTRLYYTAVFSDELKLVNKFEFDADWGDDERGDIGADGQNFEIKNSYADFSVGDWNAKVGTQGKAFARGFLFDDDFSGAIVRYVGDDMIIPFVWIKAFEGGYGEDADDLDFDYYGVDPVFSMDALKLNPFLLYMTSAGGGELDDSNDWSGWDDVAGLDEVSVYYLGLNVDYSTDMFSLWATAIYSVGSADVSDTDAVDPDDGTPDPDYYLDEFGTDSYDIAAYLFAVGGSFDLEAASLHAEFFYATGDEDGLDDDEASAFFVPAGASYYWAEIMGYGVFDDQVSNGSPADQISNIMAFNVGVSFPMDKLTLTADVWHANLVEDNADGDTDLGTEIDVAADYELVEDLNLKAVFAYLSAGDATGDENPMEMGVQLSLKF